MGRVININAVRIALVLAVSVMFVFALTAHAGKVQVPEGTTVTVKFPATTKISSGKIPEGTKLLFELVEPIEVGGKVIVDKGATGTAVVTEVKKAGRGGKPGKITVEFVELNATGSFRSPDGSPIKLTGTVTDEGGKKGFFPWLFFVFLMKGGQGEIDTDQPYIATVAESIILEEQ